MTVFLEIQNVPIRKVFVKPVTYAELHSSIYLRPYTCNYYNTVLLSIVYTCPAVESNDENNCATIDDECSSDDDCQYDRICCSNGCGGYTCSDAMETCWVRYQSVLYE